CYKTPCPIYKGKVASQVLELVKGAANIKVGDRLNIQPLSVLPKNNIGIYSGNYLKTKNNR
ncbi:MAG: DUF192 domain-containing protein, partial [Nostoc sp. C3-bin3]|nr:DUF192 domain-containing protein [Nostoc sp. C3-bin3]